MPHIEHPDGLPSVTGIVGLLSKPQLYKWYGKLGTEECERIKRESAEIGTRVHSVFEDTLFQAPLREQDNDLIRLGLNAVAELRSKPLEILAIEEHLESKEHMYHGTPDLIATYDGVPTVIDLKTSNQIYREVALQLAGYAIAWNETHETKINRGYVIQVNKATGKVKTKVFEDLDQYKLVFLGLREAWDFVNQKGSHETKKSR